MGFGGTAEVGNTGGSIAWGGGVGWEGLIL